MIGCLDCYFVAGCCLLVFARWLVVLRLWLVLVLCGCLL